MKGIMENQNSAKIFWAPESITAFLPLGMQDSRIGVAEVQILDHGNGSVVGSHCLQNGLPLFQAVVGLFRGRVPLIELPDLRPADQDAFDPARIPRSPSAR